MRDLSELELDRSGSTIDAPTAPRRTWIPVAVFLTLLIAAPLWYLLTRGSSLGDITTGKEATRTAPPATPKSVAEPGENIVLPALDESDPIVRELVGRLSSHPRVAAWLTTPQLIRNMVVVVVNIADGASPARQLHTVAPSGRFSVRRDASGIAVDPQSYARYDGHASAIEALDARGVARLYATLKPRITEAYREVGAPEEDFDRTLQRAIAQLLSTPVIDDEIRLRNNLATFEFVDPRLQSLSRAQRQFLRMGPRNMRIVQAKLREVAHFVGIPDESLPPATKSGR